MVNTDFPVKRYTAVQYTQPAAAISPLSKSTRHLLVPEPDPRYYYTHRAHQETITIDRDNLKHGKNRAQFHSTPVRVDISSQSYTRWLRNAILRTIFHFVLRHLRVRPLNSILLNQRNLLIYKHFDAITKYQYPGKIKVKFNQTNFRPSLSVFSDTRSTRAKCISS